MDHKVKQTLDFFSKSFEQDLQDWLKQSKTITNSIYGNPTPVVEVKNLDIDLLQEIYKIIVDIEFSPIYNSKNKDHNNRHDRSEIVIIKEYDYEIEKNYNDSTTLMNRNTPGVINNSKLVSLCKKLFAGIEHSILKISKIEPYGILQPHKDVWPRNGLCKIWVPIHNQKPNLRVHPFGTLNHNLGSMYLFNNSFYQHSVLNDEDKPRFVFNGLMKEPLTQEIQNSILKYSSNNCYHKELWLDVEGSHDKKR